MNLKESLDDQHFFDWMKRPVTLSHNKALALIQDLEAVIEDKRAQLPTSTRLQKNLLYSQIDNRKAQIANAEKFLKHDHKNKSKN